MHIAWTICVWQCLLMTAFDLTGAEHSQNPNAERLKTTADAGHPYLHTKGARRITRDKVTPDYAAVLTVCSRYLGVSAIQLHSEVAQLESEVLEVETTVSTSLG